MTDLQKIADRAVALIQRERPWEAAPLLKSLVQSGSHSAGLHHLLGQCLTRMTQFQQALEAFQAELEAFPNNTDARTEAAVLSKVVDVLKKKDGTKSDLGKLAAARGDFARGASIASVHLPRHPLGEEPI